ncbi:MAG: DNA-binding protein YbiB [Betaproteobacteria bacterium]
MGIAHYIKTIGRGRDGARALTREQASDLMGQVLDGAVSDLEIGAFCLAMRIKGETPEEMAGFLDATGARISRIDTSRSSSTVVLPSYNGARRLPILTPLLAHLLAREGLSVIMHGTPTESGRVTSQDVLRAMGSDISAGVDAVKPGEVVFVPTEALCPGLKRLLQVRQVIGLRNSAHSLVKLMNVCSGNALLLSSYTHPEYAFSMAKTLELIGSNALLLRGTEGEAVADARRMPQIDAFLDGVRSCLVSPQTGPLTEIPQIPAQIDEISTAQYTQAVLNGELSIPQPIARQVQAILRII